MKILIDAFGGDHAPSEIIKGCVICLQKYSGTELALVGNEDIIRQTAAEQDISLDGITIHHAPDIITMDDEAGEIVRSKKQSSMAVGLQLLADGQGDAFLSAGNSGALITGATLIVKRIKGVRRPAFTPVMPSAEGPFILADGGANVEASPEMLRQFGIMGAIYMEKVLGVKNPRVALINVGTEEHKGAPLQHEAYQLLKRTNINFIGNMEARDIPAGGADVLVADGFTGNIVLKMYEGVAIELFRKIKGVFYKNLKTKLGAAMMKKEMYELKQYFDYNQYGAAPVLGVSKPVLKTHGSAKADAVVTAVKSAIDFASAGVIEQITQEIETIKKQEKDENG